MEDRREGIGKSIQRFIALTGIEYTKELFNILPIYFNLIFHTNILENLTMNSTYLQGDPMT